MPKRRKNHFSLGDMPTGVFLHRLFAAAVALTLASCGGGGNGDGGGLANGPSDCSIPSQNEFVYDYLRTFYFWADEVADDVDPASYNSPSELLADLRFEPLDRFSYISDATSFNSFQEGQFIGIGLYIIRDINDDPIVAFAHQGSPAADSGIKRGDRITEINGVRGEALRNREQYSAAFGPSGEGNTVNLKVIPRAESEEVEHSLVTRLVTINPTPVVETFVRNGKTIGYLQFTNFFSNAIDELNDSFDQFQEEGVSQLVLDLRYNGGGRLSTANHLASLIGGNRSSGADFARLIYNSQQQSRNFTFDFTAPSNALSLTRVYILSTEATCSASEAVINGLRGAGLQNDPSTPVEIIQIGKTSCGKPVGSNPQSFCDSVMPTITFELRNAQNQGGYFDGFDPQCDIDDDLTADLGSPEESLLSAALHHIEQESCPVAESPETDNNPTDVPLPRRFIISR